MLAFLVNIQWILLFIFVLKVNVSFSFEIQPQQENELVTQQWHQSIIGNIKYARMTYQNEVVIQNFKDQIMKYDIKGNQKWSSYSNKGELIKIQKDWAILYKQSTRSLIYIELETGNALKEINFGSFKDDLPRMKSSQKVFFMYDTQNIFWVKSNKDGQKQSEIHKSEQQKSEQQIDEQNKDENIQLSNQFITGRYSISNNYIIIGIQIDQQDKIHLLLQYKKSQMCLAVLDLDEKSENNLNLSRCRQMNYNQKNLIYTSSNGFLMQNTNDQDSTTLHIVFFDRNNYSEEYGIFNLEEETHRTRDKIHQIQSFEENEIIIFKYENYFEICRLTTQDLICPDIFIKKRIYQFIPTPGYQSLLFLSSSYINVQEGQKVDENEIKKELNAQIIDLEYYQVFNLIRMKFEDNIQLVYAKIDMKNPLTPSINVLVQIQNHQVIFCQMYIKQQIINSLQEGSLQNDLPPVFYNYQDIYNNPYPQTKSINSLIFSFDSMNLIEYSFNVAKVIIHNISYRWDRDIKQLRQYLIELKQQIIGKQSISHDEFLNDRLYRFEKIILIPTKNFRLFAINSSNGNILHKKKIEEQTDQNEVLGIVKLAREKIIVNYQYISEYNDEYILIINNLDHILLQYINPQTTDVLRSKILELPFNEKYLFHFKIKLKSDSNKEHLIFITNKLNTLFFPKLDFFEKEELNQKLQTSSVFFLKQEGTNIVTYQLKDTSSGLQKKYITNLKAIQKIIKVSHNLKIIDISTKQQNLIPLESNTKDEYRMIDFENRIYALLILIESEKKLIIYVVDTLTNKLIFQKFVANVRLSSHIDMFLHENKLFLTFFSDYYDKQLIYEMKIYFKYFLTIFNLPNPQLPLDSVKCDDKTLFSEQKIAKMHAVIQNNLVFTTHSNDILFFNLQTLNETNTLTNSTFKQINTYPLSQIQNLYFEKTSLTSRYFIFANGAQVYSVNFTPESRYDTLPLDFNYKAVIYSIIFTFTLLLLSICFYAMRVHRQNKKKSF